MEERILKMMRETGVTNEGDVGKLLGGDPKESIDSH